MNRFATAESAHLNYRAGMTEIDLWGYTEENPPDAYCEAMVDDEEGPKECCAQDWKLVEATRFEAVWECRRCGNRITQEDD